MLWLIGDSFKFRISPKKFKYAPVAQLDRVPDFESVGRRFESCRAYHLRVEPEFFKEPDKHNIKLSGKFQAQKIFIRIFALHSEEGDYYV
jgi:hypothetical protein